MPRRNVSSTRSVRATPTIATRCGSKRRKASAYSAGMSFLCVRSPEAPKMTSAQASGVRRSASPSASGFSCCGCAVAVIALRSLFRALLQMAAERLPHRGEDTVAPLGLAAGGEAVEERRGKHRGRHALLDRGLHRPPAFAGIAHATGVLVEIRGLMQRLRREIEQPGSDYGAAAPELA